MSISEFWLAMYLSSVPGKGDDLSLLLDVSLHTDGVNYSESSLKICELTTPPSLAFKKIKTRHPTLTFARRILENKRGRSRLPWRFDSFRRASLFNVQKVILFFAIIAPMTFLPVLHAHPFCGFSSSARTRARKDCIAG